VILARAIRVERQQIVCRPGDRDASFAFRIMTGGNRQHAHPAEPVQRMVRSAVMQSESSLGQRPGNMTCQRQDRIAAAKSPTAGVGEPGHRIGQFRLLGDRSQRAKSGRSSHEPGAVSPSELAWSTCSSGMALLLDQLGGIWEITTCVTLPEPLPTVLKRSF